MPTLHHIGCSGGKDSSALLLWAIHESGLPRESLRVTFCDTGNEDPLTYEHLELLRKTVVDPAGVIGSLETLKPERDFFELAMHKRRFPSRKAQFCTQALKLVPTQAWVTKHQNEGYEVVVLNGKRTGESEERRRSMAGKAEREWSPFWGCDEWAPLMVWTILDVMAIHNRHNVPLNPLYALGARRVGCFPCVNSGKVDIRMVAKHRPEKIDYIRGKEQESERLSGRFASFFPSKAVPERFRSKPFTYIPKGETEPITVNVATIDDVVRWAHTQRGGHEKMIGAGPHEDPGLGLHLQESPPACWMNYGACE